MIFVCHHADQNLTNNVLRKTCLAFDNTANWKAIIDAGHWIYVDQLVVWSKIRKVPVKTDTFPAFFRFAKKVSVSDSRFQNNKMTEWKVNIIDILTFVA